MRILWDSFSDDEKPEWTSLEEIERFSKKMLEEDIYRWLTSITRSSMAVSVTA